MNTIVTTIEVDGEPREVEVEYDFYRARAGARDSLGGVRGAGPPLEPDEPAHVEIRSVKSLGTDDLPELRVGLLELIEERCLADAAQYSE
jgi:hypothetical protein